MMANADNKYQTLLQVAAGTRLRADTAALKSTYTASVAAVDKNTPRPSHGCICDSISPPLSYFFPLFRAANPIDTYERFRKGVKRNAPENSEDHVSY
jgi:hypothetical protein